MPVTTRFKDTKIDHDWLEKLIADNPCKVVIDQKTGQPNGNILTGPVRLSWTEPLWKPKKNPKNEDVYSCTFLWPLGVDLTVLSQAVTQSGMVGFPENMTGQGFVWHGLKTPFHDQAEKAHKYEGYLPGAYYAAATTQFPPRIVDPNMNDIVDVPKRCYPGALAIAAVNTYTYKNVNKGVSIGLQSLVIIGDDQNIGGGKGGNPQRDFAGIAVTQNTKISDAFASAAAMPPMPGQQSAQDIMRAMGLA